MIGCFECVWTTDLSLQQCGCANTSARQRYTQRHGTEWRTGERKGNGGEGDLREKRRGIRGGIRGGGTRG